MNVKIVSLEATFKSVLVGSRRDMFRERVPGVTGFPCSSVFMF